MTRPGPKRLAYLALTLTVLSGCEDILQEAEKPEENSNKTELLPEVASGSQRDVEAPEVFQVTEAGLWDGRPSLGGIWVAYPEVSQPERVVITNTANNKSVTGALFRRERNLPGPAIQVSSAAAEQLEMLAGAPTKVSVVALRRETVKESQPEDAPKPEDEATDTAAVSDAAATDAPSAANTEKPAKPKWWQKKAPAAAAGTAVVAAEAESSANEATEGSETTTDAAAAAEDPAEPAEKKPAKRKWWQKKEPAAAAAAGATVAAAGAATGGADVTADVAAAAAAPALSDAPVEAPAEKPAKRKWWQKKDPAEITETPLDPIEGAASAIDATEAVPAAAAATGAASSLSKPFVQIGTFSVEANANTAAEKVRRNGMSTVVRELKTENKTVWRVLVGPAATRAERKAIQKDVKDLGFKDAFTVSD